MYFILDQEPQSTFSSFIEEEGEGEGNGEEEGIGRIPFEGAFLFSNNSDELAIKSASILFSIRILNTSTGSFSMSHIIALN